MKKKIMVINIILILDNRLFFLLEDNLELNLLHVLYLMV